MIDAEWFIGSLMDGSNLGLKRSGVECRCAEGAEAAGVGYGGDQRRSRRRAHAAQHDRMNDAEQIANARVNHSASLQKEDSFLAQ
jgi:hypothetical protein